MTTSPTLPRADEAFPCAGPDVDRELFFEESNPARIDTAKTYCRRCPFQAGCLDYALNHKVEGIWGAKTTDERKKLRRKYGIEAEALSFSQGVTNATVARRMASSGSTVAEIAMHLMLTQEAVRRILREAEKAS